MKLQRADYFPNWETIADTFEGRSIYQIRSILDYFNKTNCMPDILHSILLQQKEEKHITLDGIFMFLNPIEYSNLSMTAKKVILIPQDHELEQRRGKTLPLMGSPCS